MRKSLKKMSIFAIPTLAGLGTLIGSTARGATIFSADFEPDQSYNSGTLGAPSGGYYPNTGGYGLYSNSGGEKVWNQQGLRGLTPTTTGNHGYSDGFVVANPNTSASPSSGVANTSAHVAAIVGDSSGGSPKIVSTGVGATLGTISTTADLTISQVAYYPSTNSDSRELIIGDGQIGGHLPTLYFGEGAYWSGSYALEWAVKGKNGLVGSPTLTANAWHSASITIHFNQGDLADSTMDFSVDGTTVQNGIAFDASSIGAESYYAFTDDYPDASEPAATYLDNISITQVPEPAALSLLGFGGILLARRRTRRRPSSA